MSDAVPRRIDVRVGEISGGQVVIGDHTTVQTTAGTKVTVLQTGDRPVPRLRSLPVSVRPAAPEIFGREEEIAAAARVASGAPLQIYAPEGAGKTALLKAAAERVEAPPEGVVFLAARRRSLDEIQLRLYEAFWQCDIPFLPSLEQVGGFLADREALLVLDDCGLDRPDLELLLDAVPRSALVLASGERTLWSVGSARPLGGLAVGDALDLLERELGREIAPAERDDAEAVAARLDGRPQALIEAAALVADGEAALSGIAARPAVLSESADTANLDDGQRRLVELLAELNGAPLASRILAELGQVPDAEERLQDLERRGWVKSSSPRYRLVRPLPSRWDGGPGGRWVLENLRVWSEAATPAEVGAEAEALEAALGVGFASGQWRDAVELARAAEWKLTVTGAWTAARRTIEAGLGAARELGDQSTEAHFLHQGGSLLLCAGDREGSASQLWEALSIRERLGESAAASLTRHNLDQLGGGWGGGKGKGPGPNGGPPWRPPIWATLGILAAIAGFVLVLTLFAGGSPVGTAGTATDPGATDPGVTDPEVTDPGVTDPEITDSGVTDPGVTDPGVTDPGVTDPGVTDPGVTDPIVKEPEVTDPAGPADAGDEGSVDYGGVPNPEGGYVPPK